MKDKDNKLGLTLLVLLGVGSMIGGGIFNSPTDLIRVANPQAVIISWIIGGLGVVSLGYVFYMLSKKRDALQGGIFSYAKEYFGEYMGFNSSWGYWVSTWLGNVALFILIFKTLESVVNITPMVSFISASALLWIIFYIQIKGAKEAGMINAIINIAKLLPIILAIILGMFIFKVDIFNVPNWQNSLAGLNGKSTSLFEQVNSSMGTILWCFIGVEAITVLSQRAKSKDSVGKAIIISLLITLVVYIGISVIAMGVVPATVLANTDTPFAEILSRTVLGNAGATLARAGLITSLLGASLSWVMVSVEVPYISAKVGIMPKYFLKTTKNGTPINALIVTTILTQIALCSLLSPKLQDMYYTIYNIATAAILIPYLFSAFYAFKVCKEDKLGLFTRVVTGISVIYAFYVLYAVGIEYLAGTILLYTLGIGMYIPFKREKGEKLTKSEKIIMLILIAISLISLILFYKGILTI